MLQKPTSPLLREALIDILTTANRPLSTFELLSKAIAAGVKSPTGRLHANHIHALLQLDPRVTALPSPGKGKFSGRWELTQPPAPPTPS